MIMLQWRIRSKIIMRHIVLHINSVLIRFAPLFEIFQYSLQLNVISSFWILSRCPAMPLIKMKEKLRLRTLELFSLHFAYQSWPLNPDYMLWVLILLAQKPALQGLPQVSMELNILFWMPACLLFSLWASMCESLRYLLAQWASCHHLNIQPSR